jgi:hypothetical protein
VALLMSIPAMWLATWATYVLLERPTTRLGQTVAGAMRPPALA